MKKVPIDELRQRQVILEEIHQWAADQVDDRGQYGNWYRLDLALDIAESCLIELTQEGT